MHKSKRTYILPFLVISIFVLSLLAQTVQAADDYIFDHYDDSMNSYLYIKDVYMDAADANVDSHGESFKNTSSNGYLTRIDIYMIKTGSPTGNLTCEVISLAAADTLPSAGTSVENSTHVEMSTLSAVGGYVTFTFAGTWNFTADDWFCWIVWSDDATALDTSNYVGILRDTADGHQGYSNSYGSSWSNSVVNDFQFIVYVNDESSATPTPTPPIDYWYDDSDVTGLIGYLAIMLLMGIPMFLFADRKSVV